MLDVIRGAPREHPDDGSRIVPGADSANSAEPNNSSPTRPQLFIIVILCFAVAAILVWAATLGVGPEGSAGG
jgi:hypothetical protein